jgi:hypothetical protein
LLESLVSLVVMLEGSVLLVVEQMVSTLSLVVLSLQDVLHLVINTSLGEVAVLSLRGATDHGLSFATLVLLQCDGSGFPMVVPGLIGLIGWITNLIGAVG